MGRSQRLSRNSGTSGVRRPASGVAAGRGLPPRSRPGSAGRGSRVVCWGGGLRCASCSGLQTRIDIARTAQLGAWRNDPAQMRRSARPICAAEVRLDSGRALLVVGETTDQRLAIVVDGQCARISLITCRRRPGPHATAQTITPRKPPRAPLTHATAPKTKADPASREVLVGRRAGVERDRLAMIAAGRRGRKPERGLNTVRSLVAPASTSANDQKVPTPLHPDGVRTLGATDKRRGCPPLGNRGGSAPISSQPPARSRGFRKLWSFRAPAGQGWPARCAPTTSAPQRRPAEWW